MRVVALTCSYHIATFTPDGLLKALESIRENAIVKDLVAEISGATVWHSFRRRRSRPCHHRSLIFQRDPNFVAKVDLCRHHRVREPLHFMRNAH